MDGVRTRRFTLVRCLYSNGYIPKEAIAVQNLPYCKSINLP
ncbi:hypothetical protein [Nostoc sp.]